MNSLGNGELGSGKPEVGSSPEDVQRSGAFPLSAAQLGMWFAQHLDPSVPVNIAQYVELRGPLQLEVLREATATAGLEIGSAFVRIFEVNAQPFQQVDPNLEAPLGFVDVRGEPDPLEAAMRWMRTDRSRPIDMLTDRLIAATVVQLGDDRFFWYTRVHHTILDGLGASTFVNRVAELYSALVANTEPVPSQASDLRKVYDAEIKYRNSSRFEADREYWAERIAGLGETTSLAGRSAPPAPRSRIESAALSHQVGQRLTDFLEREEVTVASAVIAAFGAYLAQMTGSERVALSLPVSGRTTAVLRRSGGMVSNVVPLRFDISPSTTVKGLLSSVATEVSGALRHQLYRHEDMIRDGEFVPGQGAFFGPWVNIMLFSSELQFGPMVGELHILSTGLIEDLGVNIYRSVGDSRTHIDFESNPNLYTPHQAQQNHLRFIDFFEKFVSAPSYQRVWDIPVATEDERRQIAGWNETQSLVPARTLIQEFDRQVSETPDATALVYEGATLTYAEFDARVNRLARKLITMGVGPESLVGLSIRRSFDLIIGMYAIVKAGGAWVPVDPDHPADRTAYILESARPVCVLTTARDAVDFPVGTTFLEIDVVDLSLLGDRPVRDHERLAPVRADNTAYVIYTSGSTGRPKGVAVTHAAINNQLQWMNTEYELGANDVYLQKTATTFDVSLWGFFMPLHVGASMVIATPDGHRDPMYVADKIVEHGVTITDFVPSMLTLFTSNAPAGSCDSLRHVFVIGEALPPETASAFRDLSSAGLHNLYGPTEAAVSVTYYESGSQDTVSVPIGIPEWNTQAHVLDAHLHPTPIGQPGELYLSGIQLARGYVGRPDITSDRFVAAPFGEPGERMYRTGDLVRWREDGNLDYIGRTDFQVKFRGQRIELGEIETVLLAHPGVTQAVVLVVGTPTGDQLVGYLVAVPGTAVVQSDLMEFAGLSLPSYMVPASLMILDALPLNTSGKLDRAALPDPVFASAKEYRAPRTETERIVAAVFAEVLEVEEVGIDDDFFDLGGNSLVATKLVTRVGTLLDVQMGVRDLFESSTVTALAARAEASVGKTRAAPALVAGERPDVLPLSLAQRRMWFLNRFDSDSGTYNLPFSVRLSGSVSVAALEHTFADLISRHESLRTIYPEISGDAQQIVLPAEQVLRDLELAPVQVTESGLTGYLYEFARRGFDVTREVPFRVALVSVGTEDHVLVMVLHHIAADGLSFGPLARDIMVAYTARVDGTTPVLPPMEVQYADYALWQREVLGSEDDSNSEVSRQIQFWKETLTGTPEQLELPTDRPRPAVASYRGAKHRFVVEADTYRKLVDLGRSVNASPYMVTQAAFTILMSRLSGSSDIAIGSPIAGRGHKSLDTVIGMFVNTLVLRTEVNAAESFAAFLTRVRDVDLSAFAHSGVPFERLVEVLNPARSQTRHPIIQVVLSTEVSGPRELDFAGISAVATELDIPIAKFDLQLTLSETFVSPDVHGDTHAVFEYATDLFDASTVERFAERFLRILDQVVADPAVRIGDVEILDAVERRTLTAIRGAAPASGTLASILESAAAQAPDAVALRFRGDSVTYRELDARSSQLARLMIAEGIGTEDRVAIAIARSVESVVGWWAVAKTGAAFVPVDPAYPSERIVHMVTDVNATVGLTVESVADDLPAVVAWWAIDSAGVRERLDELTDTPILECDRIRELRPLNAAYVIYTSGTTGLPKGVVVPNSGVANFCEVQIERYGLDSDTRALHFASPSFDASVLELLLAFGAGSTMVVVPPDIYGGVELANLIRDERVTHAFVTPSALASVDPTGLKDFRVVIAGGEAVPAELVSRWAEGRAFHNGYGPTETTIMSNISAPLTIRDRVTIGGPVRGMSALVLDASLEPVPVGVTGELYLSGAQVSRGYHANPGLTAGRFVADPFSSTAGRMYRTGDVVRWTRDLDIEYVGRSDSQVKIRGFRIELGEVETVLARAEGVAQAVAVVRSDERFGARLVAYVVPVSGAVLSAENVLASAAEFLTGYMVPDAVVVIDSLPLTVNGKLDRNALPDPVFEEREFRAPTTVVEQIVSRVFSDVLGLDQVGLDDDFFELGGNSLIATQVAARLGDALNATVAVRVLFEASTVEALASRVESHVDGGSRTPLAAGKRPESVPLSLAQQRMWFLNRFDPDSAAYNITFGLRLVGALDTAALAAAAVDVVDRHEVLRTIYPEINGAPNQVVCTSEEVQIALVPIGIDRADVNTAVSAVGSRGFDLTREFPIRMELLQIADNEHVLAISVHHISADGWSLGPLAHDVMTAYVSRSSGDAPGWEPLEAQYADYALWQRDLLGSADDAGSLMSDQIEFWKQTLTGAPDQLELPLDHPRPPAQSFRGARTRFEIPGDVRRALDALAREHNATLFMVMHSALAILCSRLSGSRDVVLGTPVAGRGERVLDDMVGMFVNTLVLRTAVDPEISFADLLDRSSQMSLDAFAHADVPFETLVDALNPDRTQSRHPIFQVVLSFQNLAHTSFELPGLEVETTEIDTATAKFDLELALSEIGDGHSNGMLAEFTYATDLFDAQSIEAFAERFVRILHQVVADPKRTIGDVEILSSDERRSLTSVRGGAEVSGTLAEILSRAASVDADAIAVRFDGRSLTYGELDDRSSRIARILIEDGVGPEDRVVVAIARSVESVVAWWGIAKSGAAFVPVDPAYPSERIVHMVRDSGAVLGLSTAASIGSLPAELSWVAIDDPTVSARCARVSGAPVSNSERIRPLDHRHPAYVIYTSGTTGLPKGVTIQNAGVANFAAVQIERFGLTADAVTLHFASPSFDASVLELLMAFGAGSRMVVVSPSVYGGAELASILRAENVTHAFVTPAALASVDPIGLDELRVVVVGGEACSPSLIAAWALELPDGRRREFFNAYGPTEATVATNISTALTSEDSVTIGGPVDGLAAYVFDQRLQPVPVGVVGELYVSGIQIARGYLDQFGLTATRFVANPYGTPGERMYRTGDVVRWTDDRGIEYVGRGDSQVKVRGYRIELGEIEAVLLRDSTVSQVVVRVVADDVHGTRLVAYVVAASGSVVDPDRVIDSASEFLAKYMLPDIVVVLDAIPLTTAGKTDFGRLPIPELRTRAFRAPIDPVEQAVAQVFADVLGVPRVGLDDDFFELGGNSLIATRVAARLGEALDTSVPVRIMFEASTVGALAERLESTVGDGARHALVRQDRPDRIPLSLAQQRMWFLNRFEPESTVDNIPLALRMSGSLDVDALRLAIFDVVDRHEVLRTVYPSLDGVGFQRITSGEDETLEWTVVESSSAEVSQVLTDFFSRGFDLVSEIPFRARLLRVSESEWILAVAMHHIAADGFSMGPLVRDVMTAYVARSRGTAADWAPLDIQYADYALWQRAVLGSEDDAASLMSQQVEYWRSNLADLPELLELPIDRPRPAVASNRGADYLSTIPADVHGQLNHIATENNSSLFMVVHATLAVVLSRLSGTGDLAVGTPVAGRGSQVLDDLVGMFVNTLVLRSKVDSGATFAELLAEIRETDLGAFGHADVPFERLVEILNPARSQARSPLFQVMLAFQNIGSNELVLPGVSVAPVEIDLESAKFDLQLTVTEPADHTAGGLSLTWNYATDLFDESTIASFAARFRQVVDQVVQDSGVVVGDLELLSATEKEHIVDWTSGAPAPARSASLISEFAAVVATRPDASAVLSRETTVTYAELDAKSSVLAHKIIESGVRPDDVVAIVLPRSIDWIVAMVAVWKAGAAYAPVDPAYPDDRIEMILEDTAARTAIVVNERTLPVPSIRVDRIEHTPEESVPSLEDPWSAPTSLAHLGYVISTSGSTGRPKPTMVPMAGIENTVRWYRGQVPLGAGMLIASAPGFDLTQKNVWAALSSGAAVHLAPEGFEPAEVLAAAQPADVRVANMSPSAFEALVEHDSGSVLTGLDVVFLGGEPIRMDRIAALMDSGVSVVNSYGPTEASDVVSFQIASREDSAGVPIGRPVPGIDLFVLDERLHPVSVGVAGELYVGGVGVGRGYGGRFATTAERFVANPNGHSGVRMYRTGDLARWNKHGELEYVGRTDFQVKLRGQRIELGEIESVLSALDAVSVAIVVLHHDDLLGDRLVGYVVPAPGFVVETAAVRRAAGERLPEYMVPASVMVIDAVPLNASGKVDRKALPSPIFEVRAFRAPESSVEQTVAQVFSDVLGVPQVGLDDDFFELGGNSLVATRVSARLGSTLNTTLAVRTIFEASTVESLAASLSSHIGDATHVPLVAQARPDRVPLSLAQQRMWFLNRFDTDSAANNIPMPVRLHGDLDLDALESAVGDVVDRHEILRTIYPEVDGTGYQLVLTPEEARIHLDVESVEVDRVGGVIAGVVSAPFDVASGVPVRVRLLRVSDVEFVLVFVVHHIATDGFSMGPLVRDVMSAYESRVRGVAPSWVPLEVQYADFALWQREVLGSEGDPGSLVSAQLGYWVERLAGLPELLELPVDRKHPVVASGRGAGHRFVVGAGVHEGLNRVARECDASLFMVVHAAFAVLLARLSGSSDVVVGTPVAGRGEAALDD
ncbi:amino acid adenylation domain-containing protein, partial [Rhodococcus erythropolis]